MAGTTNGNITPIFSSIPDIQGGILITANNGNEFTGKSTNNHTIWQSDINGSFVQRLRFKAAGTNSVTVARIYIATDTDNQASVLPAPGTITLAANAGGGTLMAVNSTATANFSFTCAAVDQWGGVGVASAEANIAISGTANAIFASWTAVVGASSYYLFTGPYAGAEQFYFKTTSNNFNMTVPFVVGQIGQIAAILPATIVYGEVSLPATTISVSSATAEVDYPLNLALPPYSRLIVGLGNTVAAGWICSAIGGHY